MEDTSVAGGVVGTAPPPAGGVVATVPPPAGVERAPERRPRRAVARRVSVTASGKHDDVSPAGSRVPALVVEPESLQRAGIQTLLEADRRTTVAGHLDDLDDLPAVSRRLRPGAVLVVGSSCVSRDDGAAFRRLVAGADGLRWPVVLLVPPEDETGFMCGIKAGVRAMVSPSLACDLLGAAVTGVARGEVVLSPDLMAILLDWFATRLPDGTPLRPESAIADLTRREREVLELLGDGRSNAEIAHLLGIQETTVRSHTYHIATKLRLRNRTQAVLLGYQYGMVSNGRGATAARDR